MINLLIVDDDLNIRMAIEKMLLDQYKDTFKIYQAENGERAIETAFSIKIEIIITDIKMPVCNGLSMIETLNSEGYTCHFIVISGFDDYAFVREAMKLGACDYLLKPIESNEFYKLMESCLLQLKTSTVVTDETNTIVSLEKNLYKNQYTLTNLLNTDKKEEALSILTDYHIGSSTLCTIAVMDIFQNSLQKSALKKAWTFEILELLEKELEPDYEMIQGEHNNLWIILLFHSKAYDTANFVRMIKEFQHKKVKVGISSPISLDEIKNSLETCIKDLELFFYDMMETSVFQGENFPFPSLLASLSEYASNLEFEEFSQSLRDWFYFICQVTPPVQDAKQELITLIYGVMQKNNKYIRVIGNHKFSENDLIETIQQAFSASFLHKEMIRIMNIYMLEVKSNISQNDDLYIQKAKKYIHSNYSKDITLTAISEHLSIHPNYFSSLFRQKTGISYTHYLRKVRIEEACKRIRDTNDKFYEIAESVGFHDTIQFNRAFKQETGESPGNYKKKIELL